MNKLFSKWYEEKGYKLLTEGQQRFMAKAMHHVVYSENHGGLIFNRSVEKELGCKRAAVSRMKSRIIDVLFTEFQKDMNDNISQALLVPIEIDFSPVPYAEEVKKFFDPEIFRANREKVERYEGFVDPTCYVYKYDPTKPDGKGELIKTQRNAKKGYRFYGSQHREYAAVYEDWLPVAESMENEVEQDVTTIKEADKIAFDEIAFKLWSEYLDYMDEVMSDEEFEASCNMDWLPKHAKPELTSEEEILELMGANLDYDVKQEIYYSGMFSISNKPNPVED